MEGFQSPNASGFEPSRINESTFEVTDRAQISEKKSSGSVWFANNFPLKIQVHFKNKRLLTLFRIFFLC